MKNRTRLLAGLLSLLLLFTSIPVMAAAGETFVPTKKAKDGALVGDVNKNNTVDATDRMLLARFLAGWEGYEERILSMDAADIDRDGDVNAKDRMLLARFLAGWSGYKTFFAGNEEEYYTVTFDANGENVENLPEPQKVKAGDTAVVPITPSREGYVFVGWYSDQSSENIYDFSTAVTADITISAGWIVYDETFTVLSEALGSLRIKYSPGNNANSVTQDIILPLKAEVWGLDEQLDVVWTSNKQTVIDNSGRVNPSVEQNSDVTLNAAITYKGETAARDFTLSVVKTSTDTPIICYEIEDLYQFNADSIVPDVYVNKEGNISNIDGVFSNVEVNCYEDAILSLESVQYIIGINDPFNEFVGYNIAESEYSKTYTVQQVYHGVPVYGRRISVSTTLDGMPNYLNSGYLNIGDLNTSPSLAEDDIINSMKSSYNADYAYSVKGLSIYSLDGYVDNPILTYSVYVYDDNNDLFETLFADATTAEIVYIDSAYVFGGDSNVQGKGADELGNERTFTIRYKQWDWFFYYMQDVDRDIIVYNHNVSSMNRVGSEFNWWTDETENSAYANLVHVYDWYNSVINRNPVAENGGIKLVVHADGMTYNAAWCGNNTIKFYDNGFLNPRGWYHTDAAGLDIMGHEYTHGVFQYTAGDLPYFNATGAINEGYADIFGCLIDNDWVHADVVREETRNIANPSASGLPSRYLIDNNWVPFNATQSTENDRGGVHSNNTVLSHAAYLMNMAGIDRNTLAKLWYTSMTYGYNATTEFFNVRLNVVHAAKDMKLSNDQLEIIIKAFDDVNIVGNAYILFDDAKVLDDGTIELTPCDVWRGGSIWYEHRIKTTSPFTVTFDYWAGGGRDDAYGGADGILLMFSEDIGIGELGGYLGIVGDNSYGIELDSYSRNSGDPNGKHIGIIKGTASNHIVTKIDDRVDDSQWHNFEVLYKNNTLTVYLDSEEVLKADNIYLDAECELGISATTGSGQNRQMVRNIVFKHV